MKHHFARSETRLAHGWNTGKAALTGQRPALKIIVRTKYSLVKKAVLREAVRRASRQGFATTDQELEIGLRSIAVPVIDSRGTLVGAMSASASTTRISLPQMIKGFVPVLRANADALGRAL